MLNASVASFSSRGFFRSRFVFSALVFSEWGVKCEPGSARKQLSMTLTDVARAAGVSPSTVSRILSGTARVTPETRQRVLEQINRLNYQPNVLARASSADNLIP